MCLLALVRRPLRSYHPCRSEVQLHCFLGGSSSARAPDIGWQVVKVRGGRTMSVATAEAPVPNPGGFLSGLGKRQLYSYPKTVPRLGYLGIVTLTTIMLYYLCLLYTSPSPRDGLLSRMPSSA